MSNYGRGAALPSLSVTSTSSRRTVSVRTVSVRTVAYLRTATSSTSRAVFSTTGTPGGCLERTATLDRPPLTLRRDLPLDRPLYQVAPHTGRPAIDRALADLDIFLCERNDLFG